ncbi:Trp biosynthesis-associated membrane protein [Brachybacterium halotolerans subsp. kimchii]|uniref:Trp biosynthesis-associated membrane protein n=1 Tax=Brachybacterium halotolerans TaxID=2795215 RepID=UPI001E32CDFE|nr:Trp biosynthesis-associated membrane protein [Brachybacterium halotolerans]UEJ83289.1 Trp biosynthesis-associated membrane protein [Brachybacterium halotolerans subsp. kimchii]
MRALLTRRSLVLAALVMSLALAGMTRATWTTALAAGFTGAKQSVDVPGQDAAPAVLALALVGGAAAVATTLASRWVRFITGPVLILVGIGAAVSSISVRADAVSASTSAVAEATGVVGGSVDAEASIWPLVALVPAVLLVVVGVLVLAVGGRWPRRRSRYQRDASREVAPAELDPSDDPAAAWDALSRGEDPSDAAAEEPSVDAAGGGAHDPADEPVDDTAEHPSDDTRTEPPGDSGRVAE